MLSSTLISLYRRDLQKLKREVSLYKNEKNLWLVKEDLSNSAGNLCLYLVGNLNHFIGVVIGQTGYVRQREQEFSQKNVSVETMTLQIDQTIAMIETVLNGLEDSEFKKNYPIEVFGKPMTTEYFLVHLSTHLSYHLGQINYHRRLLDS
jgi:hypothetical protein